MSPERISRLPTLYPQILGMRVPSWIADPFRFGERDKSPDSAAGGLASAPAVPASLGALYEALWRIEQDLSLLGRTAFGVFYWPLIRPRLADLLSERLGLHDLVSPRLRHSFLRRAVREIRGLSQAFQPFITRRSAKVEAIVVTHPRKQWRGSEFVDIYSDRLLGEVGLGPCLVLDSGSQSQLYQATPGRGVQNRDGMRALALLRAIVCLVPSIVASVRHYRALDAAIRSEFGFGCPLSAVHLAFKIAFFKEVRRSARRLIRKSGARMLFVTGGRDTAALVAAAQDVGVEAIELQHGLLSRYHPVYHFPGRPHVPYAPDRMLTFGAFWASNIDLPGNTHAVVVGSENLAHVRALKNGRVARRVFVVSQGAIGEKLFDIAVRAARGAPDWSFVFGPHPQESRKAYEQRLASLPELENFSVTTSQG